MTREDRIEKLRLLVAASAHDVVSQAGMLPKELSPQEFILGLISELVARHLVASVTLGRKAAVDEESEISGVVEGLGVAKLDLADAIAFGFEEGMRELTEQETTYSVTIEMVDDGLTGENRA